jgi:hypothetical protein
MSFLTRTMLEAERDSAWDFVRALSHDGGLQAILREEGLRAAMRAAARQADLRVRPNRPAGPGEAGPVVASATRAGSSTQARSSTSPTGAGTPISNNSAAIRTCM